MGGELDGLINLGGKHSRFRQLKAIVPKHRLAA